MSSGGAPLASRLLPRSVALSPFWTLVDFHGTRHAVADHAAIVVKPGLAATILDRVATKPADVSALAAELGAPGTTAEVYFALLRLLDAGVLSDADVAEGSLSAESPRAEGSADMIAPRPAATSTTRSDARRIFIDAPGERLRALVARHATAAGHAVVNSTDLADVHVQVADHYFEPTVARHAATARAAGREFLVAKLQGLEPWVGPCVARTGQPCFHCLMPRLRGNQLLRETALLGPRPYRCPIVPAREEEAARFLVERLALGGDANAAATTRRHGVLWTWNRETASWREHAIIRRPQCAICGASVWPLLPDIPEPSPFVLHSRPKVRWDDGSHRAALRRDVLQKMEAHVDPLTGTISRLWQVAEVPEYMGFHWCTTFAYSDGPSRTPARRDASLALATAAGKGRLLEPARAGALAEACQRYTLCRFASDHPGRRARPQDLPPGRHVLPEALLGFSERQYENRAAWRGLYTTDYVPPRRAPDRPLTWVPGWSLVHHDLVHVPRAFVAVDREDADWAVADSNGFAAGATMEEAIVHAASELIERDGVGLWWHHRVPRPGLDPDTIPSPFYQAARAGFDRDGYDLHILDVTTDLEVTVFVGLAVERATGEVVPGFGAHLNPAIALERAVSEVGQIWNAREFVSVGDAARANGHPELLREAFLRPATDRPLRPWSALRNLASPDDVRADIATLARIFETRGFDFIVVDASLPDLPVAVVKTIVPGLVHYFPRFGPERLYTAPVQLGWLTQRPDEASLNPVPMVI